MSDTTGGVGDACGHVAGLHEWAYDVTRGSLATVKSSPWDQRGVLFN